MTNSHQTSKPREHSIRVGGKAVIIRDDMILLVKYDDENGPHYNCPGGGHQSGETIRQTVAREVLEATAAVVEVGELLVVLESPPFKPDHTFYLSTTCSCSSSAR